MSEQKPLWEVMHHAFWRCPKENWRLSSAYMIRALRDWLVPEETFNEGGPPPLPDNDPRLIRWNAERRIRLLLTAEADRAERGDTA